MRYIIYVLCLILLTSCPKEVATRVFNVSRVIANNSPVEVRIEVYDAGRVVETFSIASGGQNQKHEVCKTLLASTTCDYMSGRDIRWSSRIVDSVTIVYEEMKKQTYCGVGPVCNKEERNIMALPLFEENNEQNTGYVKTIEGDTQVFTFTLTEEDYENAEPIGG